MEYNSIYSKGGVKMMSCVQQQVCKSSPVKVFKNSNIQAIPPHQFHQNLWDSKLDIIFPKAL
jgi:hypothetical protein